MKRFFSVLLVAILVVTSLATFAFAAKPGDTVTIPVTVSGEFCNFNISISVASPLQITGVSGAGAYVVSGNTIRANWASAGNVSSVTVNVTVSVPEDIAPGTYHVSGSLNYANKVVAPEDDNDGVLDNQIGTTVSVGGGSVVIDAPVHEHTWGAWTEKIPATCTEDGLEERICSVCGETEARAIPSLGHTWGAWTVETAATCHSDGVEKRTCSVCGETETRAITDRPAHNWGTEWKNDADNHWHVCTNEGCTAVTDHEGHTWDWRVKIAAGYNKKGLKEEYCVICDRLSGRTAEIPAQSGGDDVPPMGDMTTATNNSGIYAIAAVMVALCGTAALVIKRKHVQ